MIAFRDMSIKWKLSTVVIALLAIAMGALGWLSFAASKSSLEEQADNRLNLAGHAHANTVQALLESLSQTIVAVANQPATSQALADFTGAYGLLDDPLETLQRIYVTENPHPTGQKDKLVRAPDQISYAWVHNHNHPGFDSVQDTFGLYDVFLVDTAGNVVYSVFKESDFATNLMTGEWKDSGLANAYRAAASLDQGANPIITDFQSYGPSANAPASFMATPVFKADGTRLGAVIFQLPTEKIVDAVSNLVGLGQSGNIQIVGEDGNLRLDARNPGRKDILSTRAAAVPPGELTTSDDVVFQYVDEEGENRLGHIAKMRYMGLTWFFVASESMRDIDAPVFALRTLLLQIIGASLVIGFIAVFFMANSIARPIQAVAETAKHLDEGKYDISIDRIEQKDEIGSLSASMEQLRHSLKDAEAINQVARFRGAAFVGSSSAMTVVDDTGNITMANPAMTQLARDCEAAFRVINPDFDPEAIVGVPLAGLHNDSDFSDRVANRAAREDYSKVLTMQGKSVEVNLSTIETSEGEFMGHVIEWKDRTEEFVNLEIMGDQARAEFDAAGNITYTNEQFAGIFHHSPEEMSGLQMRDRMRMEQGEDLDTGFWQKVFSGERVRGRYAVDWKGERLYIGGNLTPIYGQSGTVDRVIFVGGDVTKTRFEMLAEEKRKADAEAARNLVVESLRKALSQLAAGDLTGLISVEFTPEYALLRDDFNTAVGRLNETMTTVSAHVDQIDKEANEISDAADNLARRTENQAATLEQTSAALDEQTNLVRSAAEGAEQTVTIVNGAKDNAQQGGKVVDEAIVAMGEIESRSREISKIITVIDDIAFQTNLLALNAGVEAARAGEAGRGFAVVASEVRALAQRTSEAAREITSLISSSGQEVQRGVDLVARSGKALEHIVSSVTEIAEQIGMIAHASGDQSTGITEINQAMRQLDDVTQQNAAMFEETTAATHSLKSLSKTLIGLTSAFITAASSDHSGSNSGETFADAS